MYRVGLLAVLLLAVAAAAGGNATLTCTKVGGYEYNPYYTTGTIQVDFNFKSISPVFPGSSVSVTKNYVYATASSAQWKDPLVFKVTLDHYIPYQKWGIGQYMCVYKNGSKTDVRLYEVVEEIPNRTKTEIIFRVPATAAEYSNSTSVEVTVPLSGSYCSSTPTVDSWPNCPAFNPDPNKVSVDYPDSWEALKVNGYAARQTVAENGVNATIPKPWNYGIYSSDEVTFSYVDVDGNKYEPKDASNVPVSSSVSLYMVGMPKEWGIVKLIGASMPVYIEDDMVSNKYPTDFCKPPSCFVLEWINLTTACPAMYQKYGLKSYLFVAVRSGYTITETVKFSCCEAQEIRLPLGSVYSPEISIEWSSSGPIDIYLTGRFDASSVALRVLENSTYYEQIARRGKVNGPLESAASGNSTTKTKVAIAVDRSLQSLKLGLYSWPMPSIYGSHEFWNQPWLWTADLWECNKIVRVGITPWLAEALKRNHKDISEGRYVDLLRFFYGEPTTYYWGQGDQYGAVSVHTDPHYDQTTADSSGRVLLYHVTGIAPTDVATLIVIPAPYNATAVGGGSDGSQPPPPPPKLPKWLIFIVPTAACRSMFCTLLSPELLGPLPPVAGDRALPNMGYSIMLMYIGETDKRKVKIYVEDGYVISSGPPMNVTKARNHKLVEIDKEWKPFEAVVVGPGWWVPYRRLGPCETMPVRASSIYTTPDRPGPVKVIVEDNGAYFTYVFHVTNNVNYHITTRTPIPESITATPFNITAYITLGGVPYYHVVYGYGEGGRLSLPACVSTRYSRFLVPQLMFSGDFWSSFGLANTLLKPVNIEYVYTKPKLELVNPWRGLVKIKADGRIVGFAFYAQRGGAWVKIGEVSTLATTWVKKDGIWVLDLEYRNCILVNASRIFPWDPILVLPLVEQELDAAPGSTITIWRPETALLFKTWADVVGYPRGARSELAVVKIC
jgi:hypothetical protein